MLAIDVTVGLTRIGHERAMQRAQRADAYRVPAWRLLV